MSRFLVAGILLVFGVFLFSLIYGGEKTLFESARESHSKQIEQEQQIP